MKNVRPHYAKPLLWAGLSVRLSARQSEDKPIIQFLAYQEYVKVNLKATLPPASIVLVVGNPPVLL